MLAAAEVTTYMRLFRIGLVVIGMAASSATAAPGVQLSIRDGRVWLVTDSATVGQILAEWERVGGTHIINGDHVPGGPLTLEMRGVPESEALDVVLRSASGFIAAPRTPESAAVPLRLSRFDRIVVLPAGVRPVDRTIRAEAATLPPMPPPVPPFTAAGGQRIIGPDGQFVPDDQEDAPPPPPSPPYPPAIPPVPPGPRAVPAVPPGVASPGMIPPAAPPRPRA